MLKLTRFKEQQLHGADFNKNLSCVTFSSGVACTKLFRVNAAITLFLELKLINFVLFVILYIIFNNCILRIYSLFYYYFTHYEILHFKIA